MKAIGSPVDFVGINLYTPDYYIYASDTELGYQTVPFNQSHPRMASSWHRFSPEIMYWAPRFLQTLWNVNDIYITENGCATSDVVAEDGNVYDSDRIMFLRSYITQLQRATSEGVPVRGYFYWSLIDNFEWAAGLAQRFGLIYVDYQTLKRTPKLSASFYRAAIDRNKVA